MKNVLTIFGAVLVVVCLPLIFHVLHDARVDINTESHTTLVTGVAETTSNVTLGQPLFGDAVTGVTSISSNNTLDTPTAYSYNTVSRLLTISGLVVGATRTLTIDYEIASESLAELPSAGAFIPIFAYLIIFGILGLIAGAIFGMFRGV
jgi:hypothetical protein